MFVWSQGQVGAAAIAGLILSSLHWERLLLRSGTLGRTTAGQQTALFGEAARTVLRGCDLEGPLPFRSVHLPVGVLFASCTTASLSGARPLRRCNRQRPRVHRRALIVDAEIQVRT